MELTSAVPGKHSADGARMGGHLSPTWAQLSPALGNSPPSMALPEPSETLGYTPNRKQASRTSQKNPRGQQRKVRGGQQSREVTNCT